MADITCAHCGESWDVHYLRHESAGHFDPDDPKTGADTLAPLGAGVRRAWLVYRDAEAASTAGDDDAKADLKRAAGTLNAAVYHAVLSGKGCPDCGFTHPGAGPHRARQLEQLVLDGVTDDDPTQFLGPDV